MRFFLVISIFWLILPTSSWSESLTMDDLIERNNLFYEKFTDVPFSGEIRNPEGGSELTVGHFENGKKDGFWRVYFGDGSLHSKKQYKDGKLNGRSEFYWQQGTSIIENYKNGKLDGRWEMYNENGILDLREFKDDKMLTHEIYSAEGKLVTKWK